MPRVLCFCVGIVAINVVCDGFAQFRLGKVSDYQFYCFIDALMSCHFMVVSIPYYVSSLLVRELYFDVGQYFVGQLLINQGASFLLENGRGPWFYSVNIVRPTAKYICPFIFRISYVVDLEGIEGQYLSLSNLSSVQLLSTSLVQQVFVIYIDLDEVFRSFQIHSLFAQSFYYRKKFLIVDIVVQLGSCYFASVIGHDSYLIVVPLLGKAYADGVVRDVSLEDGFVFWVEDRENWYNSKPTYQLLKGLFAFLFLGEGNILVR